MFDMCIEKRNKKNVLKNSYHFNVHFINNEFLFFSYTNKYVFFFVPEYFIFNGLSLRWKIVEIFVEIPYFISIIISLWLFHIFNTDKTQN